MRFFGSRVECSEPPVDHVRGPEDRLREDRPDVFPERADLLPVVGRTARRSSRGRRVHHRPQRRPCCLWTSALAPIDDPGRAYPDDVIPRSWHTSEPASEPYPARRCRESRSLDLRGLHGLPAGAVVADPGGGDDRRAVLLIRLAPEVAVMASRAWATTPSTPCEPLLAGRRARRRGTRAPPRRYFPG
jgi:hypothetical protein